MSSIERYIRIPKQDPIPPSTNENVNFYHRTNFFKKVFLRNVRSSTSATFENHTIPMQLDELYLIMYSKLQPSKQMLPY